MSCRGCAAYSYLTLSDATFGMCEDISKWREPVSSFNSIERLVEMLMVLVSYRRSP